MRAALVSFRLLMVTAAVAVMVVGPGATKALAAEDEEEGKRRFLEGQRLYEQGKYLEAAKEFEVGYAAAPRPAFLLNIARAYHKAGELKKANAHFDLLLQLAPEFGERADLAEEIKQVRDELAAQKADTARKKKQEEAARKAEEEAARKAAEEKAAAEAVSEPADEPIPTAPQAEAGGGDFEFERRNVMTLEEEAPKDDSSILSSPWFWVVTVGVLVGGGVALALATKETAPGCTQQICLMEPR